jgi:hypothetical protein
MKEDHRPAFVLENVTDADFNHVKAMTAQGVSIFSLNNVTDVTIHQTPRIPDSHFSAVARKELP